MLKTSSSRASTVARAWCEARVTVTMSGSIPKMLFKEVLDSRRLGGGSENPRVGGNSVRGAGAGLCDRASEAGESCLPSISGTDCIVGSDGPWSSIGEIVSVVTATGSRFDGAVPGGQPGGAERQVRSASIQTCFSRWQDAAISNSWL